MKTQIRLDKPKGNILTENGLNVRDNAVSLENLIVTEFRIGRVFEDDWVFDCSIGVLNNHITQFVTNVRFEIGTALSNCWEQKAYAGINFIVNRDTGEYNIYSVHKDNNITEFTLEIEPLNCVDLGNVKIGKVVEVKPRPFDWKSFGIIMLIINILMIFSLLVNAVVIFGK